MKTKTQTPITMTQFEMYTEIWNEIDGYTKILMDKFNTDMEDLQENFVRYLSWNAKAMFKYKYQAECLTKIKDKLQFDTENGFNYDALTVIVDNFSDDIANGVLEVRSNSTCEMSNVCSTWKFEVDIEVFKKCKSLLRKIDKFMAK